MAPPIFADASHESRSVQLHSDQELRGKGFEPFMVCQTRVRQDDRLDYTKHLIRLRHASQINGREASEIILLNSRDGTSSYQMLAGKVDRLWINALLATEVSDYAHSAMT